MAHSVEEADASDGENVVGLEVGMVVCHQDRPRPLHLERIYPLPYPHLILAGQKTGTEGRLMTMQGGEQLLQCLIDFAQMQEAERHLRKKEGRKELVREMESTLHSRRRHCHCCRRRHCCWNPCCACERSCGRRQDDA